jgi:hypothetical protein
MIYKRATQRTLFGMALVSTFVLTQYGCARAQLFTPQLSTPQLTPEPYQPRSNCCIAQPAPTIIVPDQPVYIPPPQPQPPIQLDIYGPHPRYEQ